MKLSAVHHRVDGLENISNHSIELFNVHHRVDGLEILSSSVQQNLNVHHRVDGLEKKAVNDLEKKVFTTCRWLKHS
ncbi:Uncharacterised protein [Pasteurella multocida subsp. septica]|nr:Uncharacterised protein [Pasteurella multocida subsp. septica]